MRVVTLVLACALVLGLTLSAVARDSTGPRPERFTGTITKVEKTDAGVVTVTVTTKTDAGEDKTMTFKLDDKSKVMVAGTEMEKGRDGVERPKMVEGKVDDLKEKVKVSVAYTKDTNVALFIRVVPPPKETPKEEPKAGG